MASMLGAINVVFQLFVILMGLSMIVSGARTLHESWRRVKLLEAEMEMRLKYAEAAEIELDGRIQSWQEEQKSLTTTAVNLDERFKQMEHQMSPAEIRRLPTVYLASERKTQGDIEFRARVRNASLGDDWPSGREYVLWARTADHAQRSLMVHFPESRQYVISNVRPAPEPLWASASNDTDIQG